LVPCSDEFEGQGHQGQKTAFFSPFGSLCAVLNSSVVLFAFVGLGLVSSILRQEIGWEEDL